MAAVLQQIFLGNPCNARIWQKALHITCHLHNKFQKNWLFVRVDVSNGCMIKKLSRNIGASVIKRSRPTNHGQKSWDTLKFLRRFPIHTCPTPHLTPQEMLDMCSQNSFRVSNLYWVGEGELLENFEKDALFYKGTDKLQKLLILLYFPNARTLVHDCRTF